MSTPNIQEFLFDAENEEKLHEHGISRRQANQMLDNDSVIMPNKKAARGDYLIIGRDDGDAILTISIERTHDPELWRPVTGWPAAKHEADRLR